MICRDKGNNFIIGGASCVQVTEISDYSNILIKYDENGNLKWTRNLNEPKSMNDIVDNVITDDSLNIYVTGTLGWIKYIGKYNSDGQQVWIKPFFGHYESKLTLDKFGNVYLAYLMVLNDVGRVCISRFDNSGNLSWFKQFDTLSTSWSEAKYVVYDGNVIFICLVIQEIITFMMIASSS